MESERWKDKVTESEEEGKNRDADMVKKRGNEIESERYRKKIE